MTVILCYDGSCGLCHHWVTFTLARDTEAIFRFCSLQSLNEESMREKYGDTIVVLTEEKEVLVKSSAALFILSKLKGIWPILAAIGMAIPKVLRDFGYERIAAIRRSLFKTPPQLCPIVPKEVRERFLMELSKEELQSLLP